MNSMIYRIESLPEPSDTEILKTIFGLIDLTSLNVNDSDDTIIQLANKVCAFQEYYPDMPNVAGVCVYPAFLDILKKHLKKKEIDKVIVAGNFPNAHTYLEVKLTEIELLCQSGADEIDVVFPIRYLFNGNIEEAEKELRQIKSLMRNRKLKVILEASLLTIDQLKIACKCCFNAGADFIKTSSGKEGSEANLDHAFVMCNAIKENYKETGKKTGFKPAGGIRTFQQAYQYYTIVEEVLGTAWLNKAFFRIGASSLANNLLEHYASLTNKEYKPYF